MELISMEFGTLKIKLLFIVLTRNLSFDAQLMQI